jgi:hypothetical protein
MKNIGPREFMRMKRAKIGKSHDKMKEITRREKMTSKDRLKNKSVFVIRGLVSIK